MIEPLCDRCHGLAVDPDRHSQKCFNCNGTGIKDKLPKIVENNETVQWLLRRMEWSEDRFMKTAAKGIRDLFIEKGLQ